MEVAHAAHRSPRRHYHDWTHVSRCADALRTIPTAAPRALFLALLLHDAVYVAGAADNESRSAELAMELLTSRCTLSDGELRSIERMILATRDHHTLGAPLSHDEQTMLDIDLAILGAPPDEYARYAKGVREEYVPAVTTVEKFRIGRAEFLRKLLARDHLFLTPEGRSRWEPRARDNVERELATLRGEQGLVEKGVAALRRYFRR